MHVQVSLLFLLVPALLHHVQAYIPASPTNSSQEAIEGGLNVTDISKLDMFWFSQGSYSQYVSYQLAGNETNGISKGALVHFSEEKANNMTPGTNTPWIAMVSCDKNATDASMDIDIFTLARDKGAVAALLYSLTSLACVINPEYADPANFDQVFDIFSTQSLTSAHLIDYQFGQLVPQNQSLYDYDSRRLNDSYTNVTESIDKNHAVSGGYLMAVLQAYNATAGLTNTPNTDGNNSGAGGNNSRSPNTALAMIILYAITGCVSALFCVVIITGAIRAIRHPERYGPRARGADGGPEGQSRARGLTRAILDTFPIVKFGNLSTALTPSPRKDIESPANPPNDGLPLQLTLSRSSLRIDQSLKVKEEGQGVLTAEEKAKGSTDKEPPKEEVDGGNEANNEASSSNIPPVFTRPRRTRSENAEASSSGGGGGRGERPDVMPASIGRETCPICIVDFEEGDDVRVLPCEGKHCFHQNCVDPWLLELSSSCPICRHDFFALENILSGRTEDGHGDGGDDSDNQQPHENDNRHSHGNRFSRYVRFAIGRRPRRHDEPDPTDPYMPQAPVTSIYTAV
ncbi:hypothetical protein EST38_g867 [Candolleomyces aberdarensis]|uniref:RING-type domain-containing protein n=1 Tax=Candolleomyces aberdarensis TaxID=2316362 RepID=A0A4Q2E0V0_9AGAR|nr:hypothetical protein EST38_g867 [Candolleomyces aberdarensis]